MKEGPEEGTKQHNFRKKEEKETNKNTTLNNSSMITTFRFSNNISPP
jgi:hypothetical protein